MTKKRGKSAKLNVVHRDSKTGRFVHADVAKHRPVTVTVERVPKRGSGEVNPKSARVIKQIDKKYTKALDRLAKR